MDNKDDKDVGKYAKGNRLDEVPRCYYFFLEVFTAEVARNCQHWPSRPRSDCRLSRTTRGLERKCCCESARWRWIEWGRVLVLCVPHYVHFHFARFVKSVWRLLVQEAVRMNQQVYSETPGSDCPQRCGGLQWHVGWTCSKLRWIEEIGGLKKIREKWIPSGRRWTLKCNQKYSARVKGYRLYRQPRTSIWKNWELFGSPCLFTIFLTLWLYDIL